MPTAESLGLIFQILAGLWLFNEKAYYSWLELCGIFGSTLLIIAGILILATKHNFERAKTNDDDGFKRPKNDKAGKLNAIWNLVYLPAYHEYEQAKEICTTPLSANTSMMTWCDTTAEWPPTEN